MLFRLEAAKDIISEGRIDRQYVFVALVHRSSSAENRIKTHNT